MYYFLIPKLSHKRSTPHKRLVHRGTPTMGPIQNLNRNYNQTMLNDVHSFELQKYHFSIFPFRFGLGNDQFHKSSKLSEIFRPYLVKSLGKWTKNAIVVDQKYVK
eukprot:TRINITY_DN780_c0_g1_i2.p2 TRINITY_DN780_c0_g1~~TRINITY_DN780_c0_g1_i2.p2  ORF type:complete len:105 (-),score=1.92 TRINITY_DN780_c0_g1_i2:1561-1875(-)